MERQDSKKKIIVAIAALLILVATGGVFLSRSHRTQDGASNTGTESGATQSPNTSGDTASTETGATTKGTGSVATAPGDARTAANPTFPATEGAPSDGKSAAAASGSASTSTSTAGGGNVASTVAGASATGAAIGGAATSGAMAVGSGVATSAPGFLGALRNRVSGLFGGSGSATAPSTGGSVAEGARVPASNDLGSAAPGAGELRGAAAGDLVALARKQAEEKARDAEIAKSCFTETFDHKPMASHSSGEACSAHRNLLKLKYAKVNPKSVCVRVNGTPVRWQANKGKPDEILLAPIAGPTAKISVRYCMEKTTCAEDCAVPKDEFMEAIGGVADDGAESAPVAKWNPEDQDDGDAAGKLDPELKRELASHTDLRTFEGWVSEGEQVSCGTRPPAHAAKSETGSPNG